MQKGSCSHVTSRVTVHRAQEAVNAGEKRSLKWKGLLPACVSRPWKPGVIAKELEDKGVVQGRTCVTVLGRPGSWPFRACVHFAMCASPRSSPVVRALGGAGEPRSGKGGQVVMQSAGAGGGGTMEKSLYLATGGRGPAALHLQGSPARSGKQRQVC